MIRTIRRAGCAGDGIDSKTSGGFRTPLYSFEKIWHMMIDQLINGGWNVISKT